jgi:hypothetical protein
MKPNRQRENEVSSIKVSEPKMSHLILRELVAGIGLICVFLALFSISACAFKEPQTTIGEVAPQEQPVAAAAEEPEPQPSPSPKPLPPMSHCPEAEYDQLKEARRTGTLDFISWLRSMIPYWGNIPGQGRPPTGYPADELAACEACSDKNDYERCYVCRQWQETTPLRTWQRGWAWMGLCGKKVQPSGTVELESRWRDGPPPGWTPPSVLEIESEQIEGENYGSY